MKFSYRLHRSSGQVVLAIADSNLVGKRFVENELQLEVLRDFYHEGFCGKDEAVRLAEAATAINAVGRNIINMLVSRKIASAENVIFIDGVPHAQIYTI